MTRSKLLVAAPLALAFLVSPVPASGQAPRPQQRPQQQQAPSPVVISPAPALLGEVAPLSTTPAIFTIRNFGQTPVTVRTARPSCKCTGISDIVGKTIQPGGELELRASLKAPPTPGFKDATVFVSFGEGIPVLQAKLEGTVVMPIRAEPAFVDALRDVRTGVVTLRSQDGRPFRVLQSGGKAPVFDGFDPKRDEPRAEYRLRWDLSGRDGSMPIWWTVVTDREDCQLIPLRVRNEATGSRHDMARFERQWIIPDSIVVAGSMQAGIAKEIVFELEYYNPNNQRTRREDWFRDVKLALADPRVSIELVSVTPTAGDFYEVKARVTPKAAAGPIETQLSVTTASGTGAVALVGVVAGTTGS